MARRYAAVLGLLAFTAVLIQAVAADAAWTPTLSRAIAYLIVFTIVGASIGWVAELIIDDTLQSIISEEIALQQANGTNPKKP
jgi:hypothetical protein